MDIQKLMRRVENESLVIRQIMAEIEKVIVGRRRNSLLLLRPPASRIRVDN